MAQAKRKPTTKPATIPEQFIDPATLPDVYGSICKGDCLAPGVPDGATIAFSRLESPKVGDFVIIWRRPEHVGPDGLQAMIKRLAMEIPPWVKKFPYKDHPDSNVHALLMVEQINPRRLYTFKCSDVLALHKAIGFSTKRTRQGGSINTEDLLPIPKASNGQGR